MVGWSKVEAYELREGVFRCLHRQDVEACSETAVMEPLPCREQLQRMTPHEHEYFSHST